MSLRKRRVAMNVTLDDECVPDVGCEFEAKASRTPSQLSPVPLAGETLDHPG